LVRHGDSQIAGVERAAAESHRSAAEHGSRIAGQHIAARVDELAFGVHQSALVVDQPALPIDQMAVGVRAQQQWRDFQPHSRVEGTNAGDVELIGGVHQSIDEHLAGGAEFNIRIDLL